MPPIPPTPYLNLTQTSDGDTNWGTDQRLNLTKIDTFASTHVALKSSTSVLGHVEIDSATINIDGSGKISVKPLYVTLTGDSSITGNLTVSSNINVTGNINVTNNIEIAGSAVITGNLAVGGTISGSFTLSGLISNHDVEVSSVSYGFILRSPDNSRWRIQVDNSGVLHATHF